MSSNLENERLNETELFKLDPDRAIKEYILPKGTNEKRMSLNRYGLCLKVTKTNSRGSKKIRYRKEFYLWLAGKLIHRIGSCSEISYLEANRYLNKIKPQFTDPENPKRIKITLNDVFELYMEHNKANWKANTISMKYSLYKKINKYGDKPINSIKLDYFLDIANDIKSRGEYLVLQKFCEFVDSLLLYARMQNILKTDPFLGISLKKRIGKLPKSQGFGVIKSEQGLRDLIAYINNYGGNKTTRNALKFGLITGLRASNVRHLTLSHIKQDENGEYYLHFRADEVKINSNGDEYLGLPKKIGKWLSSLTNNDGYIFYGTNNRIMSEMTLVKAMCGFSCNEKIVFHSFRKILSTFCHEGMPDNQLSPYEVEKTLFHKTSTVAEIYNKSSSTKMTRKVLSWWFEYIVNLGLII